MGTKPLLMLSAFSLMNISEVGISIKPNNNLNPMPDHF